ncbi:protein SPT2 homolog, partial [Lingula anatina]|uniref:Protein SPT2 homolog n=1 Tax=Lingula anatina TaxID=7574 RepID=A0A1S3I5S4_LINAN
LEAKKKKEELLKARADARHNKKANAMARTTKDVPKTFNKEQLEEHRKMLQEKAKAMLSKPTTANSRQPKSAKEEKGEAEEADKNKSTKHRDDKSHENEKHVHGSHKHKDIKRDRHDKHRDNHRQTHSNAKSNESIKNEKEVSNATEIKSSEVKVKPKRPPGPPPMNFQDLLKLASVKQHEPVKTAVPKEKSKKEAEARPMTQEEKDRLARTSTKEYQDWIKYGKPLPPQQPPPSSAADKKSKGKDKKMTQKKDSALPDASAQQKQAEAQPAKVKSQSSQPSKPSLPTNSKSTSKEKTKPPGTPMQKKRYLPGDARYVPGMEEDSEEPQQSAKTYLPGDVRFKPGMTPQKTVGQPSSSKPSTPSAPPKMKRLKMPAYDQTNDIVLECGPSKGTIVEEEEEEEEEKPMSAWDRIYNEYHRRPA